MAVIYCGTNPVFRSMVDEINRPTGVVAATSTGRFRSNDVAGRRKWGLTAALLDHIVFPTGYNVRTRWYRKLLLAIQSGVQLDTTDMED